MAILVEERNLQSENIHLKLGLDGGGEFLKIGLTVQSTGDISNNRKLRFKESGVKKMILLSIVINAAENYENLDALFQALSIKTGTIAGKPFRLSGDLKIYNIIFGLMSHGALHCCCYCDASKYHFLSCGELRTLSDIKDLYDKWKIKSKKEEAKNFMNCIHEPLISGNDPVLQIAPPPELHLLIGIVNHLFSNMENEFPETASKFLRKLSIEKEKYHGGTFKGNTSRLLLKNVDVLQAIAELG
jgi:hypothetical protein